MEEVKKWFKEHGITWGFAGVVGGIGYLIGRGRKKKDLQQSIMMQNQAYFTGTKDGAIKALESILKDPAATMDLGVRRFEQLSKKK